MFGSPIIDDYLETFTMLDRTTRPDGRGGIIYVYVDGVEFKAVLSQENSLGVQIALKQSVTNEYMLTYSRPIKLNFHDIIRSTETQKTYRVIEQNEKRPPSSSTFPNRRIVKVQEYEIPSEIED